MPATVPKAGFPWPGEAHHGARVAGRPRAQVRRMEEPARFIANTSRRLT